MTTFLKIQNSHANVDLQKHLFFNCLYFNAFLALSVSLNHLMFLEFIFSADLGISFDYFGVSLAELSHF